MKPATAKSSGTVLAILFLAPLLILLCLFFFLPLSRMLGISLFDGPEFLSNYRDFFSDRIYILVILNTFKLALGVTALCLILGYPVAYVAALGTSRFRGIILACVLIPYFTSILVRTYAWMIILGREGVANSFLSWFSIGPLPLSNSIFSVYTGMVHVMLPLMIFPLYAGMTNIDRRILLAARGLGGSATFTFVRIFLPLSLPGVVAGCGLVFLTALGFFITPALLGRLEDSTISMVIERQINISLNWGFASALATVLLVATALAAVAAIAIGTLTGRLLRASRVSMIQTS